MPPKRKAEAIESSGGNSTGGRVLHFLTCKDGTSDKFYEISIAGNKVTSRYGRSGAQGASVVKELSDAGECLDYIETLLVEKRKKGYKDGEVASNSKTSSTPAPKKQAVAKAEPAQNAKSATSSAREVNYLECMEGGSSKFYELILEGDTVLIRYGKIGADGVRSEKNFNGDSDAAAKFAEKTVAEKEKKGYEHTEPPESPEATAAPAAKKAPAAKAADKPAAAPVVAPKKATSAATREVNYLECMEGGSSKFYELILDGDTVFIRYGKIGADGVRSEKNFNGDADAAAQFAAKTVAEKEKKGYEHTDAPESEAPSAAASPAPAKKAATTAVKVEKQATPAAAKNVLSSSSSSSSAKDVMYLEFKEGSSSKFYEVTLRGDQVTIRYGRIGTDGVSSEKSFNGDTAAASKFALKTVGEKEKKGYCYATPGATAAGDADAADSATAVPSSGNLAEDLENGLKVFIKGSSALPYTLKKFNGGYSCSCPGWAIQVHIKGVQATSCKHLKLVRGEETEAERCQASAGLKTSSAERNNSIPAKISLAQQWTASTDPTGYIMSEKLDGMRAYWCGKKLWTRSGLPILAPAWFLTALPADLPLDGELFLGRQMFDECMSIARRTDASEDWKKLKYVVFDAPTVKGGIMNRLASAQTAFEAASQSGGDVYWTIHPQSVCKDMEHLLDELALIEAQGGEGLMLRSASAAHRGGRSSDLLKVKSFHDDEALVTDHEDGKGKYQGQVGSLVCISKTGARFKVGSGLTDAMRSHRTAPKPGTVITFKYFELTKDGVPRFPTFLRVRPDVDKSVFPSA